MTKYRLLLVDILCLASAIAFGQTEEYSLHSALAEGTFNPTTPEVAAMARYGTTEMSLYTGCATPTIPLYTYRDNDFEIPVSLTLER